MVPSYNGGQYHTHPGMCNHMFSSWALNDNASVALSHTHTHGSSVAYSIVVCTIDTRRPDSHCQSRKCDGASLAVPLNFFSLAAVAMKQAAQDGLGMSLSY